MFIVMNLLIVFFILGMFAWWGYQGVFSALIHLLSVIAAMTLSVALWEPLAHLLLNTGTLAAKLAWGVALLGPFVLWMGLFRVLMTKAVPSNVHFSPMVNNIVGGALGAVSAIFASGFLLIGIGFLPTPTGVAWRVDEQGAERSVWVPVDVITSNFLHTLSSGAFNANLAGEKSLTRNYVNLASMAMTFTAGKRYDNQQSVVAAPQAVSLLSINTFADPDGDLPAALPPSVRQALGNDVAKLQGSKMLVVANIRFAHDTAAVDQDGTLRLPAPQFILTTWDPDNPAPAEQRFYYPIGLVKETELAEGSTREFVTGTIDDQLFVQLGEGQEKTVAAVFAVPMGAPLDAIHVRNLRIPVKGMTVNEGVTLAGQLGVAAEREVEEGPPIYELASDPMLELTNKLPATLSWNMAQGDLSRNSETYGLTGGKTTIGRPRFRVAGASAIQEMHVASHQQAVRIAMSGAMARSLIDKAGEINIGQDGLWVIDQRGQQHYPFAYALAQTDEEYTIEVKGGGGAMTALSELPLPRMGGREVVFIYFRTPPDTQIQRIGIGRVEVFDFAAPMEGAEADPADADATDVNAEGSQ